VKTTIISGSARPNNNTLRAAKAIQKLIPSASLIDYTNYDLPNFNGNPSDTIGSTKWQQELLSGIEQSNLLIILTPEYNWFPTAELINTVHQLGTAKHSSIFNNKVVAFVGVSAGRGGRMPTVQLSYVFNKVFNFFNLDSITSPKGFEAQEITKCIDADGNLLENEAFNEGLKQFVQYSLKVAQRWQRN
jgi:chromate reductase